MPGSTGMRVCEVASARASRQSFFIAGLLILLCLKYVDNLGAYSIPFGYRLFSSHLISTGTVRVKLTSLTEGGKLSTLTVATGTLARYV